MFKNFKSDNSYFLRILKDIYYNLRSIKLYFVSFFIRKKYYLSLRKIKKSNTEKKMERGFLYIAFGNSFYKECINSVKILKKFTNCKR